MGELALSVPTAGGTTTTLIDTALNQWFPGDTPTANWWVYGASTVAALNVGVERRVKSWAQSSSTLTFYPGGAAWPTAITAAGTYELRTRNSHERVVQAIAAATNLLSQSWYRIVQDVSVVTATQTALYTLPSSANWSNVVDVEVQVNTDSSYTGYPYVDAMSFGLNWRAQQTMDLTGATVWQIQFGMQPPPNRILRVWGEGFYPAPVLETDVIPLGGEWYGPATEFLYAWAQFTLTDWTTNRVPAGETSRYVQRAKDLRQWAQSLALQMEQPHTGNRVNVPGRGDGQISASMNNPDWFGANNTP